MMTLPHHTTAMTSHNVTAAVDVNATSSTSSLVSLNYELPVMILVAAVLFVVIVATAFGNLLVGLALFKFRYLRTISNYLICNLALSDFLLATTILPLSTVAECLGHWVFGRVMCNFWLITDVLYCTASIWNLCVIAFDRFTATLYPLWYREKRSTTQAALYVALVWLISSAICVPPLLGWNDLSLNYVHDNVTDVYRCKPFQTQSYVIYSSSGSFFIPFFITFFLYVRIFIVLRKRMKKMRQASKARQKRVSVRKDPQLTNADTGMELTTTMTTTTTRATTTRTNLETTTTAVADETSTRSLYGSDDKSSDDDDDEDDDESLEEEDSSSQQNKSQACDDDVADRKVVKNGLRAKFTKTKTKTAGESAAMLRDNAAKTTTTNAKNAANTKPSVKIIQPAADNDDDKKSKFPQLNIFNKVTKTKRVRSSQKRKFEQREMRATIRMAIIIAVFCGMWLGFFTLYVVASWCPRCSIPRELDAFFFWLGYSNSSINPILYTIFNDEFRRAFQKILGCYHKTGSTRGARR